MDILMGIRKKRPVLALAILFGLAFFSAAFTRPPITDAGIPLIQNYPPKIYKQHEQNWAFVMDQRGLLYVGNSHGLLEYDGSTWRFIPTVTPNIVRSLAVSDSNQIFLGGYNYFGKVETNADGHLIFSCLSDQLDPEYKSFGNVRSTFASQNSVWFQTDSLLFQWHDKRFTFWQSAYPVHYSNAIRDTVYLVEQNHGLMYIAGNKIQPLYGGKRFASEKIFSMSLLQDGSILIGTRNQGFFKLSHHTITPFPTQIDDFCRQNKITATAVLSDGSIAVGTRENGLAVMDDSGRLIQVINKSSGLLGNSVWNLFTDNQNGLWVALNNGISRVDLPAPLTYYGENNGIDGTVESIVRHKGILYIATPSGLYYIAANAPVRRISDFRPYKLFAEPRFLLASGYNSGTYTMEKGDMVRISDYSGYIFCQSRLDSNRVFIGLDDGIAAIYLKEGTWRDEGKIALETGPIRDMVENDAGDLWLGTSGGIIYRLRFPHPGTFSTVVQIETFEEGRGLSSSSQNHILRYQGQALIANNNGLLQYVDATDSFTPAGPFADSAANPERSVLDMATDQFQTIWLFSKTPAGLSLEQGTIFAGKYHWDSSPFRPLSDFYYYAIYPDPLHDGVVWLGGAEGLIRYDSGIKKGYKSEFSCMIRRVYTLDDSSIYSGNPLLDASPALHYDLNSLRFEYAAPFFENEPATRYQIMLDGFDPNWSAWSAETKATYTNIPAGKYQFRVRARNIYGKISKTADFPFTIHPPWFQSWWSYTLYFLVLCMVFFGLVRLRSLNLEKEKKVLEKIVDERTDEIIVQNRRLEEQAEKLKEMDATKSRFFANISHEFRTPLTLIIGPVEEMLSNSFKGSTEKSFRTILLNAKRLLRLINQLLDLSKLDSGQMKLSAAAGDLSSFLKGILFSFSSYAEIKQIHLQYIEQQPSGLIYFDNDKIEKIAYNLISNALKFTPAGGYITLTVKDYTGTAQNYPEGAVEIIIYDSGIGIDKAYLSNVFERFVQGNPVRISGKGGSGIGLALTRELVEQHHGEIHISSEPNEGTAVSIILPKGKNHLTPDQIVVLPNSDHIKIHTVDLVLAGIDESIRTSDLSSASLIKDDPALIMVIEDHPDVRSYICEHLTETYQVEEAVDGESGLEKSIKMIPDLIISDIMMPGMDGYELTAKLKSNPVTSHIPIILLTARASDKDRIQGLELGADDYLIKPFNVRELLVRIKNLISVRRDLREFFKKELSFQPNQTDHFTMDNKFIGDVCRIIESHISDPALNTDFVQKRMSMSQRQFYRKIHALTGQSPGQLIRSMRLKQARQILGKGGSNISQIAFEVGFTNLSYFSKCFRDQYGKLPSEI